MTQPTIIFFGADSSRSEHSPSPKVYLRTLLFSTSRRGRVIESMHVALTRNETRQNFPIWVYGDEKLVRGSGLFVGDNGVATNHHFLTLKNDTNFRFTEGRYRVTVYAKLLGVSAPTMLFEQTLDLNAEQAAQVCEVNGGIYYDWGPEASRYIAHTEKRKPGVTPDDMFELLQSMKPNANSGLPRSPET